MGMWSTMGCPNKMLSLCNDCKTLLVEQFWNGTCMHQLMKCTMTWISVSCINDDVSILPQICINSNVEMVYLDALICFWKYVKCMKGKPDPHQQTCSMYIQLVLKWQKRILLTLGPWCGTKFHSQLEASNQQQHLRMKSVSFGLSEKQMTRSLIHQNIATHHCTPTTRASVYGHLLFSTNYLYTLHYIYFCTSNILSKLLMYDLRENKVLKLNLKLISSVKLIEQISLKLLAMRQIRWNGSIKLHWHFLHSVDLEVQHGFQVLYAHQLHVFHGWSKHVTPRVMQKKM